jgi:hypothetical protein
MSTIGNGTPVRYVWASRILMLIAAGLFLLTAFGTEKIGPCHTGWLGLVFLSVAFLVP